MYDAVTQVRDLLGDEGSAFLREAGVDSWEALAGLLPGGLLEGQPVAGAVALAKFRDHWSRVGALRPAAAATRALLLHYTLRGGPESAPALLELAQLGTLADRAGRHEDADRMLEEAWVGLRSVLSGRDRRLAVVSAMRGAHFMRVEAYQRAHTAYLISYRIRKEVAPETVGPVAAQLGQVALARRKPDEALPYLQEAWELYTERFGEMDKRTLVHASALELAYRQSGDFAGAVPVQRVLYKVAIRSRDPLEIARRAFLLGASLDRLGQRDEAHRLVSESIRRSRTLPAEESDLPNRLGFFARMLQERGKGGEAAGILREALEIERELFGDASAEVGLRYGELGMLCHHHRQYDEALGWLDVSTSLLLSTRGAEHYETRIVAEELILVLHHLAETAMTYGDRLTRNRYLERALGLAEPIFGPDHGLTTKTVGLGRD